MAAQIEPDENNAWRAESPGAEGWTRSARPGAADKFYMCSADGHVQEPNSFLSDRVDPEYHDRLPGMLLILDEKGNPDAKPEMYQKTEGFRPARINWADSFSGVDEIRHAGGRDPETRIAELESLISAMRYAEKPIDLGRCSPCETEAFASDA